MKTIIKFIYIVFVASLALTACSPDDDHNLGAYSIDANQISFEVTSGSNEWTYNYAVSYSKDVSTPHSCEVNFGDGATTKNLTGSHEYVVAKGTYTAQCVIYTPDGNMIVKEVTITINNDNPGIYTDNVTSLQYALTGGKANTAGKTWYIGEWSAMRDPNDRETVWWNYNGPEPSMMNDKMTFTPDGINPNGGYKYENNGDTFVNESAADSFSDGDPKGSFVTTVYTAPSGATWKVTQDGGKTILTITKGFVGYVTSPGDLDETAYEVISYSPTSVRLSKADDPQWCFELVSGPVAVNLWADVSFTNSFYYAPGWNKLPDPELTTDGTKYTLKFPDATSDQWQNQVAFNTEGLATSADKNYNFSVTLNASNAIGGVTVKLCENVDGDTPVLLDSRVDLPAGEDVVFEQTDLPGVDISKGKLIFDFGGNPANTDVVIKNITLQEVID
ncbi:hypothetical protein D0T84_06445 [Dysgonomonas sp. 521]|uniref:hypothetical protein n=1 Tax=Dysgonomonas sp. 521 TaxID=2302932 RepID=UPI0013CF94B9|nr:hypothetical protein [Dysgonomonas sp. 521]NDV94561.1 hypothetical protein [Dysgonomonas sp. 521]